MHTLTSPDADTGTDTVAGAVVSSLTMRDIRKSFAGGTVLHGVDLEVHPGTVHALVGANGAGKSTLMKILGGVYPDYDGEIATGGTVIDMSSPRVAIESGIAVIYQENSLVPDLTVADNIALGREGRSRVPATVNHRRDRDRSADEAAAFGIELPMSKRVEELGVGEQQMTEIVKALARKARFLVMDEPTARLSASERARLFEIVRRLTDEGVGIVYISHFLEEVFEICTEVTVLRDGRRVAHQPISELDLPGLARLMVGDKLDDVDEISGADRVIQVDGGPGLRLDAVELPGHVRPITIDVPRGSVLGVTGLENSGRSELAALLVGDRTGARGRVGVTDRYRGRVPRDPLKALRAGMLLVPADRKVDGIIGLRSVEENIAISALRDRLSFGVVRRRKATREVAHELIERFDVRPRRLDIPIVSLSGGNQQKVLFARVVAAGADVLLLDQPTAGVDIGAKADLYRQIDALASEGITILVFTDDLNEILTVCDHVMIMRDGEAAPPRPTSRYDRASLLADITSARHTPSQGEPHV